MPDAFTHTDLFSACEKGHNAEQAMELLAEMRKRRLEPGVFTHAPLISTREKAFEARMNIDLFAEKLGLCYGHTQCPSQGF